MKSLIEDNSNKKKGKKGRENKGNDEFKVNVDDDRFGALFSNPSDFNIDPTHKRYPFLIIFLEKFMELSIIEKFKIFFLFVIFHNYHYYYYFILLNIIIFL